MKAADAVSVAVAAAMAGAGLSAADENRLHLAAEKRARKGQTQAKGMTPWKSSCP